MKKTSRAGFRRGGRSRHWIMSEAKKANNSFKDMRSPVLQHDIGRSPGEMLAGVDRDHLSGHVARGREIKNRACNIGGRDREVQGLPWLKFGETGPGPTALTLMPFGAKACAIVRVAAQSADLLKL